MACAHENEEILETHFIRAPDDAVKGSLTNSRRIGQSVLPDLSALF